jgi:glycogen synthase
LPAVNIAILVAGLPPDRVGGAERQACEVASRLAPRHSISVFTRTATVPAELAATPGCLVIQRCRTNVRGVRFAADLVETLARIARARPRIDVVVAYQTVIDGFIAVLAKRMFGIPAVVLVRCDTEYQLDRFAQSRLLSPFVFRHADRLGVQSPTLGEELVRTIERSGRTSLAVALRSKLFVAPNGIAPVPARRANGDGVLYVGRLTKAKSVDVLVDAMRELPDERLTIVGDGAERNALERQARGLGNVSFAGMIDYRKVPQYLEQAKVLVLPSRQEGQPNVVMEAMARGLPVVATAIGGVPDLIADGRNGLLTEPGDSAAIARAIRRISSDAALRAQLAENGVRTMQQYDWPKVLDALERTLVDVVSAGRKKRV